MVIGLVNAEPHESVPEPLLVKTPAAFAGYDLLFHAPSDEEVIKLEVLLPFIEKSDDTVPELYQALKIGSVSV